MPVPNNMSDLATLASSNYPTGTEVIGNSLDDYLRSHAAIIRSTNAVASATIASASTTNLSGADGESVAVTGTTTINSFGTGFVGCYREVRFTSALTIVNSANIVLPGSVNLATAAGDVYSFRCTASGVWTLVSGTKDALVARFFTSPGTFQSLAGGVTLATAGASNYVSFRPNGAGSTSGETFIAPTGQVTVGGPINASSGTLTLGSSGSGQNVALRPNGVASTLGEVYIDTAGAINTTIGILRSNDTNHYIDVGYAGNNRTIFGSYFGLYYWRNTQSGVDVMTLNNGALTTTGGYDYGSSIHLKDIDGPIGYGLDELMKLDVVRGRYKAEYNDDGRERLFLIAEQLQGIMPETVNAQGAQFNGARVPTVKLEQLAPVIVRALQEVGGRLEALEARA